MLQGVGGWHCVACVWAQKLVPGLVLQYVAQEKEQCPAEHHLQ